MAPRAIWRFRAAQLGGSDVGVLREDGFGAQRLDLVEQAVGVDDLALARLHLALRQVDHAVADVAARSAQA